MIENLKKQFPLITADEINSAHLKEVYDVYYVSIFEHSLTHEAANEILSLMVIADIQTQITKYYLKHLDFIQILLSNCQCFLVTVDGFSKEGEELISMRLIEDFLSEKEIIERLLLKENNLKFVVPSLNLIFVDGFDFSFNLYMIKNSKSKYSTGLKYINQSNLHFL